MYRSWEPGVPPNPAPRPSLDPPYRRASSSKLGGRSLPAPAPAPAPAATADMAATAAAALVLPGDRPGDEDDPVAVNRLSSVRRSNLDNTCLPDSFSDPSGDR